MQRRPAAATALARLLGNPKPSGATQPGTASLSSLPALWVQATAPQQAATQQAATQHAARHVGLSSWAAACSCSQQLEQRGSVQWVAQRQWARLLSTAAQEEDAAATAAVHDTLRPKILRFFALFMICGAGLNVLPHVAAASVGNCLALLQAQEPFMVKAGCSRLQLLMRAEAGRQRAVELGAAAKLLHLAASGGDEGVVDYAMSALEALAGCEAGLESLRAEGGRAKLAAYLAATQRTPTTEDAIYRAQQLLAALDRPPAAASSPPTGGQG